jgi:hypothetical protein
VRPPTHTDTDIKTELPRQVFKNTYNVFVVKYGWKGILSMFLEAKRLIVFVSD